MERGSSFVPAYLPPPWIRQNKEQTIEPAGTFRFSCYAARTVLRPLHNQMKILQLDGADQWGDKATACGFPADVHLHRSLPKHAGRRPALAPLRFAGGKACALVVTAEDANKNARTERRSSVRKQFHARPKKSRNTTKITPIYFDYRRRKARDSGSAADWRAYALGHGGEAGRLSLLTTICLNDGLV